MSEIIEPTEPASATLKRRPVLFIIITTVILLPLLYWSGSFVLPALIKSGYQGKNCGLVLGLNNIYISIYSATVIDKSLANPASECTLYSLATSSEEKKAWQNSYDAYTSYSETYSEGLFITEAHEHSAVVLTAWAKELMAQKEYKQAVENLNHVFKSYADTSATTQATDLMPEVYTAWGADLRASSDFAGSENTLKAFEAWAQSAKKNESVELARHELVQTYLAWGLALQSQEQFEDAETKLDLAIATNPEPLASSELAAEAKAAQAKLYSQWGDDLV